MASTPSTLVIYTQDKINFPIKVAMVVMKQIFQYGVKDISAKGGKILLSLTYSPKTTTLKKKFGNLPVRYMRVKIEKEDDFKILENVVKRYRFNLLDEQPEDLDRQRIEAIPGPSDGGNKKYYLEPAQLMLSDNDSEEDDDSLVVSSNKNKRLKTRDQKHQQSLEEINIEHDDDELTRATGSDTSNINDYLSQQKFF